eukprot:GHVH01001666.1.p1 GENE.GHVH01001666.1~~GHVH01001666.1.p1  ORF type:complete len:429 (+),score=46.07 GHVH01001666.1:69-1289(+)
MSTLSTMKPSYTDDRVSEVWGTDNLPTSTWQQLAMSYKLKDFFRDAYASVKESGRSDIEQRTRVLREARAKRIATGQIEIVSMLKHCSDDSQDVVQMRTSHFASSLTFVDRDQFIHFIVFEWNQSWVPKGVTVYTGFAKDQGCNWDGGGRDWIEYTVGSLFDVKWIRWLKLDERALGEINQFPCGQMLLNSPVHDVMNYSWIRCSCPITDTMLKSAWNGSWDGWLRSTEILCNHLTKMRQYISVGALLRVMRKAQCLHSQEFKYLKLRQDEHIYMSINPDYKIVVFSQYWNELQSMVPLSFARSVVNRFSRINIPVTFLASDVDDLIVQLDVVDPTQDIDGLSHIYSQIKIQLHQRQQKGVQNLEATTISSTNPPMPSLCWFKAVVLNTKSITLGDAELAAIAEIC